MRKKCDNFYNKRIWLEYRILECHYIDYQLYAQLLVSIKFSSPKRMADGGITVSVVINIGITTLTSTKDSQAAAKTAVTSNYFNRQMYSRSTL